MLKEEKKLYQMCAKYVSYPMFFELTIKNKKKGYEKTFPAFIFQAISY